ncbi:aminotransferase class V-fold PLP-dependent enzyme [Gilvimarinus agarilyticus]|uniref:cysteine desulfurase family protein n=1 Tax=Gilvimarinus sp. 2_MG-2023 TaxID=3062666 RepID=UPI001C082E6D|nr:aminotransferase class V-fold PLP-dependent enzyme [Gilvimarinus sp. 2_MG-2023]MBU2887316.1 aminotransferase class V-fold PLP-dependent enzyme [Gilvimarinus agarilyticus]MDO6571975.1 aminotransferase class V-fold PLP-dependent enzyme [Gilvimarinus sp. 2_MG-2023]
MNPIYLDYAATTPVAPKVAEAMAQCLTEEGNFANPASRSHVYGWRAEEAVEAARGQVAALINADAREIVWTSGATESNNLALKGLCRPGDHLIVSSIEHKAVLDVALWLKEQGIEVDFVEPTADGTILPERIEALLKPNTRLVSVMWVNNELGTVNPIADISALCQKAGVLLHVDAAQALGKLPIDLDALKVDALSLSAHKCYGPKGIGALYVKRSPNIAVQAQIHGGGHERGMRSGTLPTHQCVGFGLACELAGQVLTEETSRISKLRDRLWQSIRDLPGVRLNGEGAERVCGHLNVAFTGIDGEVLLLSLRQLAVSTGSACTSASMSPSYVLNAIGLSAADALASIRISLGRYTDADDIEQAAAHIRQVVLGLQGGKQPRRA